MQSTTYYNSSFNCAFIYLGNDVKNSFQEGFLILHHGGCKTLYLCAYIIVGGSGVYSISGSPTVDVCWYQSIHCAYNLTYLKRMKYFR